MRYIINRSAAAGMILLFSVAALNGQNDSIPGGDTLHKVKKTGSHSLFAGAGYGSNMVYLGSTISQDKPYGYASITYGHSDAFYLSLTAVHLSGIDPFVAFYAGTAGLNHTFNSWFDISAGISRYQVPASLTDTLFNSFTYGEINLGVDWRLLYTRFSAGGIFSGETRGYYQVKNSRYFQTPEFTKKRIYFSFDPYANLIFGTLTRSETTTGTIMNSFPPFRKQGSGSQSYTSTTYTNVFGLLEIDFGIPVAFNAPRLTIEAEPGYIYPLYEEAVYPGTRGFLFLLSLSVKLF